MNGPSRLAKARLCGLLMFGGGSLVVSELGGGGWYRLE